MFVDYTPDELAEISAINAKYDKLDAEAEAGLASCEEGSADYNHYCSALVVLTDERMFALDEAFSKFELRQFSEIPNDPAHIIEDAKDQTVKIIADHYEGMKTGDLVRDPDSPDSWIPRFLAMGYDSPKIPRSTAVHVVNYGLRLHYAALDQLGAKSRDLRQFVYDYIDTLPYICSDEQEPEALTAAEEEACRTPLPLLRTYGMMNDKVNTQLVACSGQEKNIDGQLRLVWGINQASRENAAQIPTYVSLQYEGAQGHLTKPLTAFDIAVYNAVSTRFYYHQREGRADQPLYITPQEIWRTMTGAGNTSKTPSDHQVERVSDSLDKMRGTHFFMDLSGELKANYFTSNDERIVDGCIDDYLLNATKVSFKTDKGRKSTGYRINAAPILYTYNSAKKHIVYVQYDLLDTSSETGNEGNTIEIRNYLLQQIQLMHNRKRGSNRILFSTLYRDTAILPPEERLDPSQYPAESGYKAAIRKAAKKDRDKIEKILSAWISKSYISGFTFVKKGRQIVGVDVSIPRCANKNE